MRQKLRSWTIVAASLAVVLFLLECAFFHFPFQCGLDAILLAVLILVPGLVFADVLHRQFHIELSGIELLSLSSALGFGFSASLAQIFHSIGWPLVVIYAALTIFLVIGYFSKKKEVPHNSYSEIAQPAAFIFLFVLIFFAAHNLQCFHFAADGAIVTRGLFGLDLPFLAGEIHGTQDFGSLRDLHNRLKPGAITIGATNCSRSCHYSERLSILLLPRRLCPM